MKICILDPSYENSESPMKDYDPLSDVVRHLEGHECETVYVKKAKAVKQIVDLSRKNFDVFINLCDGAWDEDRPGIEVVQTLERLGLPFTGSTSGFYEPSREIMKRVCHVWGIKSPAYVLADNEADVELAAATLTFPMIVKHPSSYSSIGLTKNSRVKDPAALRREAKRMSDAYGGALIEEFIDGREFSVLLVENADDPFEPFTYRPVEFRFPKGETFKHFDLKWIDYEDMECIECDDDELAERLREMSRKLFIGMNGAGYGRCDIRMNEKGDLFMLEINANCDVANPVEESGSADHILMNDAWGHKGFFERIIKAALKRHRLKQKKWKTLLDGESAYGMYAAETIQKGEVIEAYEERPHVLVSRSHVMQNWNPMQVSWFGQYAFPITDEIFVSWSEAPEDWKPINHSCDPSAWLDGLNLVARRRLEPGEQITMDYATFCNEMMEEFECSCGSRKCRRVIRGTDYLESFMERYGEHVSDYVKTKRKMLLQPQDA